MIDEAEAGQIFQNIKEFDEELSIYTLEFAELLNLVKKEKLYKYLGLNYWNDFLKDIGIPISEANTLINVYTKSSKDAKANIHFRRLKKMLKVKVDEELEDKARTLPYYEFIDEINMKKGKRSRLLCDHNEGIEYYGKCKKCGSWHHLKDEKTEYCKLHQGEETETSKKENKVSIDQTSRLVMESSCTT